MTAPDFERARQYAVDRLERQLSADLVYHSRWHTCDDVAPAVERLAALEHVSGAPLLLLRTAAYYHDIGFVERASDHEAASVQIACGALPAFGYGATALQQIGQMIMATRLPQSPAGLLEQILADADLDVLGRADFWPRNLLLRAELAALGRPASDEEWLRGQLAFLEGHRYWTRAARRLRNEGKRANVAALRGRLARRT